MAGSLVPHKAPGQGMEIVVHQRDEIPLGVGVAAFEGGEQARNIARGRCHICSWMGG